MTTSDGRRSSAHDYANRLFAEAQGDAAKLITALGTFDAATAAQAAHLLRVRGHSLESKELVAAVKAAAPPVQAGFRSYIEASRENERVRAAR
jgi:hypothetical protein